MKRMRKVFTLIMVLAMVLAMAVPAMATEVDVGNVTISGGADAATYSFYRLLDATHDGQGKYAYTLNDKFDDILKTLTAEQDGTKIVEVINGYDADEVRAFADQVYAKIKSSSILPDATATGNATVTNLPQGYYLIAEEGTISGSDTRSLLMLNTVGDKNVSLVTKESPPSITKEVYEYNDSTNEGHWGDSADYDVGDTVEFRLRARLSGQYDYYKNYWYEISDEMSLGLTFNADSLKICIGEKEVTNQFTVSSGTHKFTATANLKKIKDVAISHNTVIDVTYSCTLNGDAVTGPAGNKNKAKLRYQNDPYATGDPDTDNPPGETPPDTTVVFTFDGIVNKIDDGGNAVTGAGFTLYKWYAQDNVWKAVSQEVLGTSQNPATFTFQKLDAGIYKLEETTVPDGYNKAEDIEFHIHPVYDTTKEPAQLTGLKVVDKDQDELSNFTITLNSGSITTNVVNKAGVELPTTGGMGTTLFYVLGGLLVAASVVLLVTKKRMN